MNETTGHTPRDPATHTYTGTVTFFFWLLWLTGGANFLVCMLLTVFTIFMPSAIAIWNCLVVVVQWYTLNKMRQAFNLNELPVSELMWKMTLVGIGIPFIASGACWLLFASFTL